MEAITHHGRVHAQGPVWPSWIPLDSPTSGARGGKIPANVKEMITRTELKMCPYEMRAQIDGELQLCTQPRA
jgi:hypothetical protein